MSRFTFVCPRSRADESGAHDITDAMASGESGGRDDRILCRRCGQVVPVPDAIRQTEADLDVPDGTIIRIQTSGTATGGTSDVR